jgi:D-glycero-D-manno-heptose 1,7-bisphosphate phosphatase
VTGILFLDRDGVLDASPPEGDYVRSVADLRLLPGVPEALAKVRRELPAVPVVVVTNQRGIALGRMSRAAVDAIHAELLRRVRDAGGDLDGIEVCPHDTGTCVCRKPGIAMLQRALARYPDASAAASVVVGDSLNDLQAAAALGARSVLVGAAPRRTRVRAAAEAAGVPVDAESGSLVELVGSGILTGWLGTPQVVA